MSEIHGRAVDRTTHMLCIPTRLMSDRCYATVSSLLRRLAAADAGQDLAEYGIALAVIGSIGATIAGAIALDVNTLWQNAQSIIDATP